MKAVPIFSRYYRILDEDFYAGLRSVTAKADIDANDYTAFKIALRSAVGSELSLKEREDGLRQADAISDKHPSYRFFFNALASYIRCKNGDVEPIRSLADFYMWRKAGRPALHGIRHGKLRPSY